MQGDDQALPFQRKWKAQAVVEVIEVASATVEDRSEPPRITPTLLSTVDRGSE
jgi:hypothetical protein